MPPSQAHIHAEIGRLIASLGRIWRREADQAVYLAKISGRNKVSLPLSDSHMVTKTSYYTGTQLERLAQLARMVKRNEASLLREALDDVLKKYNDRLGAPPRSSVTLRPADARPRAWAPWPGRGW